MTERLGTGLRFSFVTIGGDRIVVDMKRTRRPYVTKTGVWVRGVPNLWPHRIITREKPV